MMTEEKKPNVLKNEEIKELKDEQLESVTGGLTVPSIGAVTLSGIKTGQMLPEDTGFGVQHRTDSKNSPTTRRPKL